MQNFSKSTAEIIMVVEETKKALILNARLGCDIDEAVIKASVRTAVNTVADALGVHASTVADKCRRNLEINAEGFEDLVIDHFAGGSALADAVCAHSKTIMGEDDPANIRAALNALRF